MELMREEDDGYEEATYAVTQGEAQTIVAVHVLGANEGLLLRFRDNDEAEAFAWAVLRGADRARKGNRR